MAPDDVCSLVCGVVLLGSWNVIVVSDGFPDNVIVYTGSGTFSLRESKIRTVPADCIEISTRNDTASTGRNGNRVLKKRSVRYVGQATGEKDNYGVSTPVCCCFCFMCFAVTAS